MLVLSHHIFEASRSAQSYEYPLVILVLVIHVQEGERRIHKLRTHRTQIYRHMCLDISIDTNPDLTS